MERFAANHFWHPPLFELHFCNKNHRPHSVGYLFGARGALLGDDDKVLFAENAEITTGDIAVVALDGSIFIRGVLFNKDESITLRPRNQDYPDMLIDPKEQEFYVVGKVLKAIQERKVGKIW